MTSSSTPVQRLSQPTVRFAGLPEPSESSLKASTRSSFSSTLSSAVNDDPQGSNTATPLPAPHVKKTKEQPSSSQQTSLQQPSEQQTRDSRAMSGDSDLTSPSFGPSSSPDSHVIDILPGAMPKTSLHIKTESTDSSASAGNFSLNDSKPKGRERPLRAIQLRRKSFKDDPTPPLSSKSNLTSVVLASTDSNSSTSQQQLQNPNASSVVLASSSEPNSSSSQLLQNPNATAIIKSSSSGPSVAPEQPLSVLQKDALKEPGRAAVVRLLVPKGKENFFVLSSWLLILEYAFPVDEKYLEDSLYQYREYAKKIDEFVKEWPLVLVEPKKPNSAKIDDNLVVRKTTNKVRDAVDNMIRRRLYSAIMKSLLFTDLENVQIAQDVRDSINRFLKDPKVPLEAQMRWAREAAIEGRAVLPALKPNIIQLLLSDAVDEDIQKSNPLPHAPSASVLGDQEADVSDAEHWRAILHTLVQTLVVLNEEDEWNPLLETELMNILQLKHRCVNKQVHALLEGNSVKTIARPRRITLRPEASLFSVFADSPKHKENKRSDKTAKPAAEKVQEKEKLKLTSLKEHFTKLDFQIRLRWLKMAVDRGADFSAIQWHDTQDNVLHKCNDYRIFSFVMKELKKKEALAHVLEARNTAGYTPLHTQVKENRRLNVEYLLKDKANPNAATTLMQWTPLHIAAASLGQKTTYRRIIKLLIEHGALIHLSDKDWNIPRDLVLRQITPLETLAAAELEREELDDLTSLGNYSAKIRVLNKAAVLLYPSRMRRTALTISKFCCFTICCCTSKDPKKEFASRLTENNRTAFYTKLTEEQRTTAMQMADEKLKGKGAISANAAVEKVLGKNYTV